MSAPLARKVLLIGWDAADWKVIDPLMEAGLMPSLQSLVARGVRGNIATLDPPLSPMLWTSIATGKTADEHGVLGFVQPTEDGTAVRPVLGTTRKVKAIWNILNQSGLRSNVVGWWPSHPAETIRGAVVSNFYHRTTGRIDQPWPLAPGTVTPPELSETLAALRVHPQELNGNHLLPFVPLAAETDDGFDRGAGAVAKTLAEAASVHAAATYLLEETEWDFAAVYYDAIDHFGHGFMKFHPPHRPGISEVGYERYHGVMTAAYRFHDMMLGRLLELAGPDTTVVLLSDHGFHSDNLRPMGTPREPAGPAFEHRDFGVFVMAGPGILQGERVHGVSLLDIAPTVLTLFGLPVGQDMAGAPVVTAFERPPRLETIPSWENVEGDAGTHPPEARLDPWAEQEAMRQLIELGYVEPGTGAQNVESLLREAQFYLARVHLSRGRPDRALPLLQAAFEAAPEAERYGLRLVETLRELGQTAEAHAALDRVAEARQAMLDRLVERADADAEQAEAGTPDAPIPETGRTPAKRAERLRQMAATIREGQKTPPPGLGYHRGLILLAEGRAAEAVDAFRASEKTIERFPMLSVRLGEAYLQMQRWTDAEAAFDRALTFDPHAASAHRGRALALLRQDRHEEAAEAALEAVGLQPFMPAAHHHLGEALMYLGAYAHAAEAFEVAVAQAPGMRSAHHYLSELYRLYLGEPALAQSHLRFATDQIADASAPATGESH